MLHLRRLPGILYQRWYVTATVIILILTVIYYLIHWGIMCTNLETWQHVSHLCHLHRKGEAIGSLCKPLCDDKQIHSLTCHAFHAGKEAVFSAEWEGTRMVFKASKKATSENMDPVFWLDSDGAKHYPTEDEFDTMVRNVVVAKLNLTISKDQLSRLSRLGFSRTKEKSLMRQVEMQNLWFLLQDNEYVCSILYADRDIFPQLLGTCGPFFAVEYVDPVQMSSSVMSMGESREEWATRLKLAVLMMDLLDELETNLVEPFHLCDIKMSHFGLIKGGQRLKFLDLDSVLPRSVAGHMTADGRHCTRHEDCDFFDCRSKCNAVTSRCDLPVTNNNFQVVCEKIFLGWTLSGTVIVPGLLMSQHTPSSLAALLRLCANPETDFNSPRAAVSEDIKRRLYATLIEMEQALTNDVV